MREPAGVPWGLVSIGRITDRVRWRHLYPGAPNGRRGDEVVALGSAWAHPLPDGVELRRSPDGWLVSELAPRQRPARPELAGIGRWVAAPHAWAGRPRAWAARASLSRLKAIGRHTRRAAPPAAEDGELLGYLRRTPSPGWVPLYSGWHPVLDDQYVSCSEIEVLDLGYTDCRLLGYAIATPATPPSRGPREIPWGSGFGQRRRFSTGPASTSLSASWVMRRRRPGCPTASGEDSGGTARRMQPWRHARQR